MIRFRRSSTAIGGRVLPEILSPEIAQKTEACGISLDLTRGDTVAAKADAEALATTISALSDFAVAHRGRLA